MMAKMIASGENRAAAIARLQSILASTVVFGVATNLALLQTIAAHPAFREGTTYTSFLDEHGLLTPEQGRASVEALTDALCAAALLDLTSPAETRRPGSQERNPWHMLGPWRTIGEARRTSYEYQQQRYRVAVSPASAPTGAWQGRIDEQPAKIVAYTPGLDKLVLIKREH